MPAKNTMSLAERFAALAGQSPRCWLWQGRLNDHGYGVIDSGGHSRHGGRPLLAHRVSWEIAFGPIPEGMNVLHDCPDGDNPRCVNPAHLWLGTIAANNADMAAKGRNRHGEAHHNARLNEALVLEIRYRHAHGERSRRALSAEFGIGPSTLDDVLSGRTWKHLPMRPERA